MSQNDFWRKPYTRQEFIMDLKKDENRLCEYWRKGDFVLLFSRTGHGKSILAMQIADCISKGFDLQGKKNDFGPQKVCMIDLEDNPLALRYDLKSQEPGINLKGGLKLAQPPLVSNHPQHGQVHTAEVATTYVTKIIKELYHDGFQVFVVDSMIYTKAVVIMHELKKLVDEFNVSILLTGFSDDHHQQAMRIDDFNYPRYLKLFDGVLCLNELSDGKVRYIKAWKNSKRIDDCADIQSSVDLYEIQKTSNNIKFVLLGTENENHLIFKLNKQS